jgi:hypothetical protein
MIDRVFRRLDQFLVFLPGIGLKASDRRIGMDVFGINAYQ